MIKTYSEIIKMNDFQDRFEYLKLKGVVGKETFAFDRWLNQKFYSGPTWRRLRDEIIVRDDGCDLAMPDRKIHGKIFIHHINPVNVDDIVKRSEYLLDPDFLICCSKRTHDAIHYGDASLLTLDPVERKPGDTIPWR